MRNGGYQTTPPQPSSVWANMRPSYSRQSEGMINMPNTDMVLPALSNLFASKLKGRQSAFDGLLGSSEKRKRSLCM
ncbi:hypothetical protein SUGI_0268690 [Cryptomeria japonica]|nr:hypothetical protein SUGI_0268690 [Cryptomeria japonica]